MPHHRCHVLRARGLIRHESAEALSAAYQQQDGRGVRGPELTDNLPSSFPAVLLIGQWHWFISEVNDRLTPDTVASSTSTCVLACSNG